MRAWRRPLDSELRGCRKKSRELRREISPALHSTTTRRWRVSPAWTINRATVLSGRAIPWTRAARILGVGSDR